MEAEPTWHHFGGKINWFKRSNPKQKTLADTQSSWIEEPRCKLGFNSRMKFASKWVQLDHGPSSKVGPYYYKWWWRKDVVQLGIKGGNGLKEVSYLPSETNVRLGAGGNKRKSSRAFKMGPSWESAWGINSMFPLLLKVTLLPIASHAMYIPPASDTTEMLR